MVINDIEMEEFDYFLKNNYQEETDMWEFAPPSSIIFSENAGSFRPIVKDELMESVNLTKKYKASKPEFIRASIGINVNYSALKYRACKE